MYKLPDINLIGVKIKELLFHLDRETFNGSLLGSTLLGEMLYGPTSSSSSSSTTTTNQQQMASSDQLIKELKSSI
jgi:hypothetical protein